MESCWNAISASQTSEGFLPLPNMGNKRDQPRLDTCIPDTRGWCPVRKQKRPSCLLQEGWSGWHSQKLRPVDSSLSGRNFSDLWSMQLAAAVFCHNTVCGVLWAYIRDKYRLNLTGLIKFTICCVLWCWQRCWGSQMSSCRGSAGLHAVCQCCKLAVCHESCVMSDPCLTADQDEQCKTNAFF